MRSLLSRAIGVSAPVLLTLFAFACGGEEPPPVAPRPPPMAPPPPPVAAEAPPPAPKPSLAEMQKLGLGAVLEALNTHDPKKFASVYADGAVISVAGLNEVVGREAITQNMTEWFETFSKVKLGFSRVWIKGDTMVLEWVINGKHSGDLFGVKGTEQEIGHYGLSLVTFNTEDGKVMTEHRYGELGTVMTQVGAAGKVKPRAIPEIPKGPELIPSSGTPDEDKSIDVAKSLLASLDGKKEAEFLALLDDDVEHDGMFHLETTKGKAEAKKFHKSFTTAFPDAKFEVSRGVAIGDYAILESVLKATHKGALGQIPPTKRPVEIHFVDVFKVKGGKVARVWTYQNSLEMQQQLGLFQVKAVAVPASQAGPAPAPKAGGTAPAPKSAAPAPKPAGGGSGGGHGGGGGGKGTGGGEHGGGGGGKGTGGGGKK